MEKYMQSMRYTTFSSTHAGNSNASVATLLMNRIRYVIDGWDLPNLLASNLPTTAPNRNSFTAPSPIFQKTVFKVAEYYSGIGNPISEPQTFLTTSQNIQTIK